MGIDFLYRSLEKCIIRSYTSGDFDNSVDQLGMSLNALNRLYNKDRFNGKDLYFLRLSSISSLMAPWISVMQLLLNTLFGEGKKQYCRHGPYHEIFPRI